MPCWSALGWFEALTLPGLRRISEGLCRRPDTNQALDLQRLYALLTSPRYTFGTVFLRHNLTVKTIIAMKNFVLALTLLATMGFAQAQSQDGPPPGGGGNQSPELQAAIKACMSSATKGSDGKPVFSAVEACLKAKGFEKPAKPSN